MLAKEWERGDDVVTIIPMGIFSESALAQHKKLAMRLHLPGHFGPPSEGSVAVRAR